MRTLAEFLETLQREANLDDESLARYESLWPDAAKVADQIESNLPAVPWFSKRRRREVFVQLCERIDRLQDSGELDDEQAQLVLTLLRSRHTSFRRAETSFVSWAEIADATELAKAPLTARQLLIGINYHRQQKQKQ